MDLTKDDFNKLSDFVYKKCGIVIKEEKTYLIKQRLEPLVQSTGCDSFAAFYRKLLQDHSHRIQDQIIVAITTNETYFFRDDHPFDAFKNFILPHLGGVVRNRKKRDMARKGAKVRIWSAASSTGQEPYCLSMLISEYVQVNKYLGISAEDFEIMATDISSKVLAQAIAGEFGEFEIGRGLPPSVRDKYFIKDERKWIVKDEIKKLVEFRRLNLMEPFTMLGGFDVIFCRNVLIYFDDNAKRRIFDQFHSMLPDDGFLLLGASESTYGITDQFKSVRTKETIIYKKN